jgi:hypothetical protein
MKLHYRNHLPVGELAHTGGISAAYELRTTPESVVVIEGAMRYPEIVPLVCHESPAREDKADKYDQKNIVSQHYINYNL